MDEEGKRLKRVFAALLIALVTGFAGSAMADAQEIMVYVAPGALEESAAQALLQLLEQTVPQADFARTDEAAGTLWDQVLGGEQPELAICSMQEIKRTAGEGLLLPLDLDAAAVERVEDHVLYACKAHGKMVMAPLLAQHRSMAVNRRRMEELEIAALTDTRAFPVWQVMQLYQVLEEAVLADSCGMEIWPAAGEDGDALFAFMQALYGGEFTGPGEGIMPDLHASVMALEWLCEMVDSGWIGVAQSREEALEHFLDGETALFIDWTDAEAKRYASGAEGKAVYMSMSYPSSLGIPVRDAQVTGIAALDTGDEKMNALLTEAVGAVMRDERLERVIGGRAIYRDDALWLAFPGMGAGGSALRGMLGKAVDAAIAGEIAPEAAMRLVREAAGYSGR